MSSKTSFSESSILSVHFLGGKSKSGFPNPKLDFSPFWANPKTDHESIKSTLLADSSNQIQIRVFKNLNLSGFFFGGGGGGGAKRI